MCVSKHHFIYIIRLHRETQPGSLRGFPANIGCAFADNFFLLKISWKTPKELKQLKLKLGDAVCVGFAVCWLVA